MNVCNGKKFAWDLEVWEWQRGAEGIQQGAEAASAFRELQRIVREQ